MNRTRTVQQTLLNLYYSRRCEEADRQYLRDRYFPALPAKATDCKKVIQLYPMPPDSA